MAERFDQENDKLWNREPGILIVPGSNFAKEMQKFEQFPSQYGPTPGNPYVYRPFPKMVYRAELHNGKPVCMAAPPDPLNFQSPQEAQRAEEQARRFTERCQLIVKDERELQAAMENGYRQGPAEAVAYLEAKLRAEANAAAERNYADRNMGEAAKAEAAKVVSEADMHVPEIPEKPRRGRPRKTAA